VKIAASILAAGKGARIGMPKWQLLCRGKTFLEIIVDNLFAANIGKVVCVVRADSMPPQDSRMQIAINPEPEQGMLSSVYYGIAAASASYSDVGGYLIMPVDHPLVQVKTLMQLRDVFALNPDCVIVPQFNGRRGHPIIIPHELALQITKKDFLGRSLRDFLLCSYANVEHVQVDDCGILQNINTWGQCCNSA
jgi:molybdenum cofactor cytidylyltransferase